MRLLMIVMVAGVALANADAYARTCWTKATFVPGSGGFSFGYGEEEIRWIGVEVSENGSEDDAGLEEAEQLATKWVNGMWNGDRYLTSRECDDRRCRESNDGRVRTWCYRL